MLDKTRQDKTRQDKTGQDRTGQGIGKMIHLISEQETNRRQLLKTYKIDDRMKE